MQLVTVVILLLSYIIGSIPIGFLFARWRGVPDIRHHGSGSTGATNVSRLLGFRAFLIVFILDAFKAYLWIYLLQIYAPMHIFIGCIGLLMGNGFSIFLQSKSGKSIATSFGILSNLHPLLLMWAAVIWFVTLVRTKTVGVASITVLIFLPIIAYHLLHDASLIFFMALWGLLLHKDNIRDFMRRFSIS